MVGFFEEKGSVIFWSSNLLRYTIFFLLLKVCLINWSFTLPLQEVGIEFGLYYDFIRLKTISHFSHDARFQLKMRDVSYFQSYVWETFECKNFVISRILRYSQYLLLCKSPKSYLILLEKAIKYNTLDSRYIFKDNNSAMLQDSGRRITDTWFFKE